MSRKRSTLTDVARAADVSVGVVSSVLNGNRHLGTRVSTGTQARIREAARDLGYRPNALARSLKSRQTRNLLLASYFVGSVSGSTCGGFFTEFLDGALSESTRRGYDLMIHRLRPDDDARGAILGDGRADGCLWLSPLPSDPALPRLDALAWPLVVFGTSLDAASCSVRSDNAGGVAQAVEHLVQLGHSRLAYLGERIVGGDDAERWDAFRDACVARGIVPNRLFAERTEPDECGRRALPRAGLVEFLRCPQTRPTAILTYNDGIGIEVIRAANELGLDIPRELSVIGFDSTFQCELTQPALTSIRQPVREMAIYCIDTLIRRIEDDSPALENSSSLVRFPCRIDMRGSTTYAPETARENLG